MQSGGSAGDDDDKEEEAKEVFLSPGALVDIANVKSKPELNGRAAKVIGFDEEKGRYLVELLEGGKEKVALKRKCLLVNKVHIEGKPGKTGREEDAVFRVKKDKRTLGRYVDTDYNKCIGCHICSDVCPSGYIDMGLGA